MKRRKTRRARTLYVCICVYVCAKKEKKVRAFKSSKKKKRKKEKKVASYY